MALATVRGGGARAQPAQRAGLAPASRAPRWGRATTLAILASLIVLAIETGFTAIRMRETPDVSSSVLFTPMVFAAILAVLLVIQALRADGDARALADSEERFRVAVEAARCGIWEWGSARTSCSCPTSPARCWAGAAAASPPPSRCSIASRPNTASACARRSSRRPPTAPSTSPSASRGPTAGASLDRRPRPGGRRAQRGPLHAVSSAWRSTSPRNASPRSAPRPPRCGCKARSRASRGLRAVGPAGPAGALQPELPRASSPWTRAC